MWADTKKSNNDSGWIYTVLCCYVDGKPEPIEYIPFGGNGLEELKDGSTTD